MWNNIVPEGGFFSFCLVHLYIYRIFGTFNTGIWANLYTSRAQQSPSSKQFALSNIVRALLWLHWKEWMLLFFITLGHTLWKQFESGSLIHPATSARVKDSLNSQAYSILLSFLLCAESKLAYLTVFYYSLSGKQAKWEVIKEESSRLPSQMEFFRCSSDA